MTSGSPASTIMGRPPSGFGFQSIGCTRTPVSLPSLPRNSSVLIFQRRVQPSSWDDVVFSVRGQLGQGFCGSSGPSTGFGMISICVTDLHPCLWDVPMQSEPVSPPPMTSTSLPLAVTRSALENSIPARTRFCCERSSRARCTPFSSRPGALRSRAVGVPVDMT